MGVKNRFVSVIVLAAGKGSRFGENKMLALLGGETVIRRSLEVFENSEICDEIIVVADDNEIKDTALSFKKVKAVAGGGRERIFSAENGVKSVSPESTVIAVHDGARPLVTKEEFALLVNDAEKFGASTLCYPMRDTVKIVSDGTIEKTPQRSSLMAAATPQAFSAEKYRELIRKAAASGEVFTDDASIFEFYGERVHITPCSRENLKITYKEDIAAAEAILKEREKH